MTIIFTLLFTRIIRIQVLILPQHVLLLHLILNVLELLVTIMLPVPSMIANARKLAFLLPTLALKLRATMLSILVILQK